LNSVLFLIYEAQIQTQTPWEDTHSYIDTHNSV